MTTARHPIEVGVGFRTRIADALLSTQRRVDFLEFVPENFVGRGGNSLRRLHAAAARWPLLAHGVSANLGGPDPFDEVYIHALGGLLRALGVPFYSDHLCWTRAGGYASHDLLPLPFTAEAVAHTATRIRRFQDLLGLPVAIENISTYAEMPGAELDEPDFVTAVCEAADCGLMLDVNNVFVNAHNHRRDAAADLLRLPLHRAIQMHVAGHEQQGVRLVDTHGGPVIDAVLALARLALTQTGVIPVLFEWDTSIPAADVVLDEADRVRAALNAPDAPDALGGVR